MIESKWSVKYLGIPYLQGGRTTEGCDCWGLVVIVYDEELGIALPKFDDRDLRFESNFGRVETPAEFDVVLLARAHRLHTGIILNASGDIFHTTENSQAVIARASAFSTETPEFYRWKN